MFITTEAYNSNKYLWQNNFKTNDNPSSHFFPLLITQSIFAKNKIIFNIYYLRWGDTKCLNILGNLVVRITK